MQTNKGQYPILILFRHGQTDHNAQKRFQGQINCPLNANGFDQALQTGNHITQILQSFLNSKLDNVNIVECLTSDLQRSKETAQIVARVVKKEIGINLNFVETEVLREYHAGDLANYTLDEYSQKHPGVMENYFKQYSIDPWDTRYPGKESESWNMVSKRISGGLKKLNQNFIDYSESNSNWDSVTINTPKNIHIWSTHGGIIGNLLHLMSVEQIEGGRVFGNGDVLVLVPMINYKKMALDENEQIIPLLEGTRYPTQRAINHECFIAWKIIKHAKVGDSITALTDLHSHVK